MEIEVVAEGEKSMKIKDLISKIEKYNKLSIELEMWDTIHIVLIERLGSTTHIYNKSGLKQIKDKYINEVAERILNTELEQIERYIYKVDDEFQFQIAIERR